MVLKLVKNFVELLEILAVSVFIQEKNLGAFGDAGGVVSNNKTLINKIKQLRDHGRVRLRINTLF